MKLNVWILCLLILWKKCIACPNCLGFRYSRVPSENTLKNRLLRGFNLSLSHVQDDVECFKKCVLEDCRCTSVNYKEEPEADGSHICELNFETKSSKPSALSSVNGFLYINIEANNLTERSSCSSTACKGCCQSMNPCLNDGVCVQLCNGIERFKCICPPEFIGRLCQKFKPRTCSDYRKHGFQQSGEYSIDPDSDGLDPPFMVYCDMVDKGGRGVTVVGHDSESRILADGCEESGCYSRKVTYIGATMEQLAKLTEVSSNCEQYIKYECQGSSLINLDNEMVHGYWLSRNDQKMDYWGGVLPPNKGCQCGLTNSCADTNIKCNCHQHDNIWREDSGYLTDKSTLPVSELRFGDLSKGQGVDEKGYHTLGKLLCFE